MNVSPRAQEGLVSLGVSQAVSRTSVVGENLKAGGGTVCWVGGGKRGATPDKYKEKTHYLHAVTLGCCAVSLTPCDSCCIRGYDCTWCHTS